MALSTLRNDQTGQIISRATRRAGTSSAVGRENAFIKSKRKSGWSSGEARRVHRGRNKRQVQAIKAGIASRRKR